jgi:DNA uptake protein ComE-like DNA-binding protein
VIVLWIAFGLVSLTLYFANSTNFELRAADNKVCGIAADQAIEGAVRYVSYLLANQPTNGLMPDPNTYECEAVSVGDSHFWLIGRDANEAAIGPAQLTFGLVDEASKLSLNAASSNMLASLPRMSVDLTSAILEWRDTNGVNGLSSSQSYYAMMHPPYQVKGSPFESVDELRLLYGADMDTLVGEDANRNGLLDPNENDENRNGVLDPGILEYVTVYSREPNTNNGASPFNVRTLTSANADGLRSFLQTNLSASRADQIVQGIGLTTTAAAARPGTTPGRGPAVQVVLISSSPLQFYQRCHAAPANMTTDEFAQIANLITVTNSAYIEGRVNINTASAAVLACLPGVSDNPGLEQTLVNYRQGNPDKLTSIAWVVDALGQNNAPALTALAAVDCITTQSYQFSADVAALGPRGKGYRRARFVFDTADGAPKIIYRQDLTHLGWALGKDIREAWLLAKGMN